MCQYSMEDTISAVATAPGEGGIGIVRLSGRQALSIADQIFAGLQGKTVAQIRSFSAAYGQIIDPVSRSIIDEALLLVMRAPHSYTKEDIVEIQCHGGMMPIRKILAVTLSLGARLAEPGEFTKRAFLNGRLDLTQAEAVIDVIRAKTDASLHMAVSHLSGTLSHKVQHIRQEILTGIAHLEASIDFPEADIEELGIDHLRQVADWVISELNRLLATAQTGRVLRDGLATVIIGKPNVGKSSLLNALLREQRAIVTDIPGTTRDVIEEYVNIGGVPLRLIDTAGLRETEDLVERIGMEKTREFVNKADLILLLLDASLPLSSEDQAVLTLLKDCPAIVLINKTDLPPCFDLPDIQCYLNGQRVIKLSLKTGSGLTELEQQLTAMVYQGQTAPTEAAFIYNVRHIQALNQAKQHIADALLAVKQQLPVDCVVIDLRAAWQYLGHITGETIEEDIIDQIFKQFCIGK